jgi:prepilin-type N-terminal cleavage/methylation domain-containing protein
MRKAFTLIELLVVIAIIAILAAILFPVFAQAKSAAKNMASLSNIKQIGTACMLYLNDNDDTMIQGDDYAEWVWLFRFAPYIKGTPPDFRSSKSNIFYSPTAPGDKPQYLSGGRYDFLVANGLDVEWKLVPTTDPAGVRAFAFWASYAINETTVQEFPNASQYAEPSDTLLFLEATDTEIEADELRKLYSRTADCSAGSASAFEFRPNNGGNAGGTNFTYFDTSARFRKTGFAPDAGGTASPQCNFNQWRWPQGGRGAYNPTGGTPARPAQCGEWTAPADVLDRATGLCMSK